MNTPSHFLMTAALRQSLRRQSIPAVPWLLGSVAPDMALCLLSLGGAWYYRVFLKWSAEATWQHMFGTLYFHHPFWIASHNLLHSPTLLLLVLACLWSRRQQQGTWWSTFYWFFLACLLHSVVDILTHVDDGPLLFFPFEWTIRYQSPVSYWDHRHYGTQFAVFELLLDAFLVGYLGLPRLWQRLRARARDTVAEES